MQKAIGWGGIVLGALMIGAIGAPFLANNQAEDNAGSIENIATQLTALEKSIDEGITVDVNVEENTLTTEIHDKLFEDDAYEANGEALALDEIESRDFKKSLQSDINNNLVDGEKIESYKDIDKIVVRDVDTRIVGNDVFVDLDLKVYYHVNDDEDEEGRARVSTTITVIDAANDDEDNREDAEVDEYYEVIVDRIYG